MVCVPVLYSAASRRVSTRSVARFTRNIVEKVLNTVQFLIHSLFRVEGPVDDSPERLERFEDFWGKFGLGPELDKLGLLVYEGGDQTLLQFVPHASLVEQSFGC